MNISGPECHPSGIVGFGDPSHRVMVIGTAPAREEMAARRPMVGQGGKLFDAILRAAGWSREKTYITNVVCWNNTKPTAEEIAPCRSRLLREIAEFRPKLIIPVGNIAADEIFGSRRHKGDRGAILWDDRYQAYVMTTYQPAAVLYSKSVDQVNDLLRDFQKIPLILGFKEDGSQADVQFETVHTPGDAQRVMNSVPKDGRFVSVDIETNSKDTEVLDVELDRLMRVGIGWRDDDGKEQIYTLRDTVFADGPLEWPIGYANWTFQYGQFDTYGLSRYLGIKLPIKEDTVFLSACRDERPGRHKLKIQAREYCASGWYDEQLDRANLGAFPADKVDEYNAKDVAYTLRLAEIHTPYVIADGMMSVYRDMLIPAANVFRDAQEYGIRVDHNRIEELWSEWSPRYDLMTEELKEMAREEGFTGDINLRSPNQLRELFFKVMGIEPTRHTKKGAPSTDKYFLDALDHPIGAKMRALRTCDTMLKYCISMLENLKPDGRIHPNSMLHNTATGRTAYHDPAVQTIPEEYTVGEDYARLAETMIATDDDYELAAFDYEQIEVWICWAYTQDPQLLEDLQSGDVHSSTAEGAFNTTRDRWEVADWQIKRQNAKKIRFGLMYGEGAEMLSTPPPLGIGGTARECQRFIDNFWSRYRVHRAKLLEWERTATEQGELVSAFGRKRRFPLVLDHRQLRQAINFPIQSTAGDYVIMSMIEIAPLIAQYGGRLLLNVHDALKFEYPKKNRDIILPIIKHVMEKPKVEGFPSVKVVCKVGQNFGQMKKLEIAA